MQLLLHFFVIFSKNIVMEWFYVCLIAFVLLLFLLFLPLLFSIKCNVDVMKNLLVVKLKLFFIPIKTIKKELTQLLQINKKDENKKKDKNSMPTFLLNVFNNVKIMNANLFCEFGKSDNAMQTALACGVVNILFCFVATFLNNCKDCFTHYEVKPSFYKTNINLCGKISMFFIPLNILVAFIQTKRRAK